MPSTAATRGVLFQAQASDKWAEYQADSIKARIVETALLTAPPGTKSTVSLQAAAADLRARQPNDKATALGLGKEA